MNLRLDNVDDKLEKKVEKHFKYHSWMAGWLVGELFPITRNHSGKKIQVSESDII